MLEDLPRTLGPENPTSTSLKVAERAERHQRRLLRPSPPRPAPIAITALPFRIGVAVDGGVQESRLVS
jgi:hypothetical protein